MSQERTVKIFFLADTHLGFDDPRNPRVVRARRGDDFFNNFKLILDDAVSQKADLIVHGGDLFYRSKIPDTLVDKVFTPIMEVVNKDIPFLIVPGNHERSFIPRSLFHTHPNLIIFDSPKTYNFNINNISLSFSGFPFVRHQIREKFGELLHKTSWENHNSDFKFLCFHHAIDGAKVGVQNYTFRNTPDVIDISEIPGELDAVLSGHIHRAQIIENNLEGKTIDTPVIYPGSIERTSFAERNEIKGYYKITLTMTDQKKYLRHDFIELPTRKMHYIEINTCELDDNQIKRIIEERVSNLQRDAVIQLRLKYDNPNRKFQGITAAYLRSIVPSETVISLSLQRNSFNSNRNG